MTSPRKQSDSNPIRIAYVIDKMEVGGTEGQLAALVNGLDRSRFTPYFVTIHEHENCFDLQCERFFFPTTKLLSPNAALRLVQMASMFRSNQIQIVHTFFMDATLLGVLAARLARVPIIISSRRDLGFWYTPLRLGMMRALNRLTSRILVNSESVRQNTIVKERISLDRVDVIYNGLLSDAFSNTADTEEAKRRLGLETGDPIVGIVSNMNREVKRLDVFVEAIPLVLAKVPSAKFVIVGGGHLKASLEKKCEALGVTKAVTFTGGVRDVGLLLPAFDVGVNCSDSEGFSNAVMEYMAAGIPAVVSDVGGNRELIEDGSEGFLFPPGDHAILAEKLIALLVDLALAKEMGARGREKATRCFSTDTMIQKHMEYYKTLLAGSSPEMAGLWEQAESGQEIRS